MTKVKQVGKNQPVGGIQKPDDPELLRSFDVANQQIDPKLMDPTKVKLNLNKFRLSGDGIFYTLQGEGKTMGIPVVFLRLHLCNLRCEWCDAYYTWNAKSKEFWTESYELTPEQTAKQMEDAWGCKNSFRSKRAVITGGEPLLQKEKIEVLMKLLDKWSFEIETNGTILPTEYELKHCQFNCSPKLSNSKNPKMARIKPEVLAALNKVDTQFKFVIMSVSDIDEIEEDFVKPGYIDPDKVLLMPQGVSPTEVWTNGKVVAEYAKEKGYRLLGRLHVDLWGAKRKV